MAIEAKPMRFTLEQYERMAETGVLEEDAYLELIDGEIIQMPPISPEHQFSVDGLVARFIRALGDRVAVRVQGPVRLPPDSQPEPDVALLVPPLDRYRHRHPGAEDTLLAIEVAKTTLQFDRRRKMPLYARNGIAEAWLVDVVGERIEVYRDPADGTYATTILVERDDVLSPLAFPDVVIDVGDVLG